tara:strand:+ start:10770 stop:12095 length:1326 start_codon:yes stop_codon:yes gene_type:complete
MEERVLALHEQANGDYEILSRLIDANLFPNESNKQTLAEYPTLHQLRHDMLATTSKITGDFWKAPCKVFEPCCGKGGFLIDVYCRFMCGLSESITDPEERRRVILTEVLYFADINQENVAICKLLLDPQQQYTLNCYSGDTLTLDIRKNWDITGFDLVLGNPPFNSQTGTNTGSSIWQCFTKLALNEWLNPAGHLLFVHPAGWRKPCYARSQLKGLYELMTQTNHMKYLSIHGLKDGKKSFNCGTRYDYYLIKCGGDHGNGSTTIVNDEDSVQTEHNLHDNTWEWLPNKRIEMCHSLINQEGEKCPVFCDSKYHAVHKDKVSDTRSDIFKYPLIHSTPKSGIRYKYANYNDKGHFGIKKVIFGEGGIHNVVVDMEGEYGLTQGAIGIVVRDREEAEHIRAALMCAKFQSFLESTRFGNYRIDWRLFTYLPRDFWREFAQET